MESLCIVSEQQVWTLRLEVVVLDDGGNCAAAAALAGLAALAHFRRPDVTLKGDKVTVRSWCS
jgi:exosome complex component RRP45